MLFRSSNAFYGEKGRLTTLITPLVYSQVEVTLFMEKNADVYKLKATIGKNEEIYLELKAELIEDIHKTN